MKIEPAFWDDPDVRRLATDQQTEIRARYGGKPVRGQGRARGEAVGAPDTEDSRFFERVLGPA